jgi:hypothetical protein
VRGLHPHARSPSPPLPANQKSGTRRRSSRRGGASRNHRIDSSTNPSPPPPPTTTTRASGFTAMGCSGLRLPTWAAAAPPSPSDWDGRRPRRGAPVVRRRCSAPSSTPAPSAAAAPSHLAAGGSPRVGTAEHDWLWDCRGIGGGGRDYAREMEVAVRVVQAACTLCQRVQSSLLLPASASASGSVHSKIDRSPVTVAGWSCCLHS